MHHGAISSISRAFAAACLQLVLVGLSGDGYQHAPLSLPGSSIDSPHETRLMESPVELGELQAVELSCG